MLELNESNTIDYLMSRADISGLQGAHVELLGWGVSNVVLRVFRPTEVDLVIKQCREKLRTKAEWFSRLDRIFREIGMLQELYRILPAGVVPRLLFEDRENYLFGMEAIPANHVVWKQQLLDGKIDLSIADKLGDYLSQIHSASTDNSRLRQAWGDLTVFDELRLDPFYRYLAQNRTEATSWLNSLIEETLNTSICLVLADFSPKNILVVENRIVLVDFETGHFGDPAFDLGFFLSHLLLKSVRMSSRFDEYAELTQRFWSAYWRGMAKVIEHPKLNPVELVSRTNRHVAGCMWSRIDGKSTVDYLQDPQSLEHVRMFCSDLFQDPSSNWKETLQRLKHGLTTSK